jgi:hypothetical protein
MIMYGWMDRWMDVKSFCTFSFLLLTKSTKGETQIITWFTDDVTRFTFEMYYDMAHSTRIGIFLCMHDIIALMASKKFIIDHIYRICRF